MRDSKFYKCMGQPNAAITEKPVSFRRLIRYLADHVGRQHIPLRTNASDIAGVLGPDSVHHELIVNLVRAIYKANGCGHLDAPVFATQTFNALGKVRGRLHQSPRADVDQINLIEDIGWAVRQLLNRQNDGRRIREAAPETASAASAQVLPLPNARFQRG